MIIKARSRGGGRQLASYLLRQDGQEACVINQRGSVLNDLHTVLHTWEKEAMATTKGQKPLYHMAVRLAPGEALEDRQWFALLDAVEKRLKLTDHPRAVVAHHEKGERHLHVVYSRLDSERWTLRKMSFDRKAHHDICSQMEQEFGLRTVERKPRRERNGNEKTRSIEHRMAKEAGTKRQTLCRVVMAAWTASKTGREFQERLTLFGITMSEGDKRDYNLWHEGKRYSPVRLLEMVRTPEFRAKMRLDPPVPEPAPVHKKTAESMLPSPEPPVTQQIARGAETDLFRRHAENLRHGQIMAEAANDNRGRQRATIEDLLRNRNKETDRASEERLPDQG